MELMKRRRELMEQKTTPSIINLCPAATGTDIYNNWPVSSSYCRYTVTGLDPAEDYTLQATWTEAWETDGGRRIYVYGATTKFIRPMTGDVPPFMKYTTVKPTENGTIEIAANYVALSNAEYAASIINIQLEIGSVAHPYVPYIPT